MSAENFGPDEERLVAIAERDGLRAARAALLASLSGMTVGERTAELERRRAEVRAHLDDMVTAHPTLKSFPLRKLER
jgi:hypothetical protein